MKYSFTINQKAIVESGLKLDLHDACIMAFLNSFALYPRIEKKMIGNKIFCWFQYDHIVKNLPLLSLKKDAVYRRLKFMCEVGLLETHPDNQVCGKAFFHLTEKFFNMFFDVDAPTGLEPYPYVSRTVPPTGLEPYNKDINNTNSLSITDKDKHTDLFAAAGVDVPAIEKTKRKNSGKKEKLLMRDAPEFDIEFLKDKFTGTVYLQASIEYYYEAALAWSDKDGKTAIDWTATVRGFILRDKRDGKLVTAANKEEKLSGIHDTITNWEEI